MAKGGRPTKYKPEFCETVVSIGKEGGSKAEMACAIGVMRNTMGDWEKDHPEFSNAVKLAVEESQAWWEKKGRSATFGGYEGFNASAFIFQMKNRFRDDYRDKVEVAHSISGIGELIDEIQST